MLGTVVLYLSIYGIVKNRLNMYIGLSGVTFSYFTYLFLTFFINFLSSHKHTKVNDEPNEQVRILKDSVLCSKVMYGKFTNGVDTINRYNKDNKDFEISNYGGFKNKFKIKWLDQCSYVLLSENGSVLSYIQIGNFDSVHSHDRYIKPISLNTNMGGSRSRYFVID